MSDRQDQPTTERAIDHADALRRAVTATRKVVRPEAETPAEAATRRQDVPLRPRPSAG
jgi:hypothetical protein